jgi:hypothetical protein
MRQIGISVINSVFNDEIYPLQRFAVWVAGERSIHCSCRGTAVKGCQMQEQLHAIHQALRYDGRSWMQRGSSRLHGDWKSPHAERERLYQSLQEISGTHSREILDRFCNRCCNGSCDDFRVGCQLLGPCVVLR